jgi:hypothetical protein
MCDGVQRADDTIFVKSVPPIGTTEKRAVTVEFGLPFLGGDGFS